MPSSNVRLFAIHFLSLESNFRHAGFKVLSEAERTAALYSLLQHSTQVQIRFFITVLQQMARSDPMTALLSPALGGKHDFPVIDLDVRISRQMI